MSIHFAAVCGAANGIRGDLAVAWLLLPIGYLQLLL